MLSTSPCRLAFVDKRDLGHLVEGAPATQAPCDVVEVGAAVLLRAEGEVLRVLDDETVAASRTITNGRKGTCRTRPRSCSRTLWTCMGASGWPSGIIALFLIVPDVRRLGVDL